jgi:divalent metal cation (Fe/Co/Zn/Cd) transporter
MSVDINLWAVLLAGVSSMVIGMLYYSNALYGKAWKKLAKVDEKRFQKEMPSVMPLVFAAALITAYVTAYVTFLYHNFFQGSWVGAGVVTALVLWVGVSATTTFVHNSLDQRPSKLTAISLGNRLLSILAMGLIIGWLHP